MIASHRRQIIHGVEGCDLISPHIGHIQFPGDELDHRDRKPALSAGFRADLALGKIKQSHNRRGLTTLRIARHQFPSRSEEHTSELQSLMRTSYAVFCLKKKNQ